MKRRITSDHSFSLKRRSSSLFSIETIDQSRPSSELNLSLHDTSAISFQDAAHKRIVSLSSPYVTTTETESSSTDGFFVDEESDDENSKLVPSFLPVIPVEKSDECMSTKVETKPLEEPGDLRTGIVFNAGAQHFDRHNRMHKERPLRVTSIMEGLRNSDIQEKYILLEDHVEESSPEKLFLEDEDYLQVHLPGYMKRLDRLANCDCCDTLDREAEQYKSIYFAKGSVSEAKAAAASLCRLVTKVVDDDLDNGFAIIRPPGHHAEPGMAGGYCIINNVAVAAAYAREKLGVTRVLIVDWDVHHGNGTQSIFLNDPDVLYFSVHRWHRGCFFPFLQNGGPTNVGIDEGKGFNVNVGWSRKGMGDAEYLAVWEKLLMPMAREFQPELVLVSAGFDAAIGDMGECNVTPECFGRLTRSLMTLADGKVVCALEGGYVRSVLANCVESVVSNLLDRASPEISHAEAKQDEEDREGTDVLDMIDSSAAKNILSTIAAHEAYWACLREST